MQRNAKPAKRRGRKATGPRFLREATDDSPKDPKIARLPILQRPNRSWEAPCKLVVVGSGDFVVHRPGGPGEPGKPFPECNSLSPTSIQLACKAWDAVFNQCTAPPFEGGSVPTIESFEVSLGNVGVWESGDRTVGINGILLPTADDDAVVQVWVHLIGPENTQEPFLPRDGSGELSLGETRHDMVRVWFGGRTVAKGKKMSCHPKGTGVPATVPLRAGGEGTLVITACPAGTIQPYPACLSE